MLWVKPKKHLFNPLSDETIGDLIQIRLPQNALDPGIYIAIGNAGKVQPGRSTRSVSQIHVNFNAIHAPDVMGYWTTAMNDLGLPFCFAVGHESDNYDRADPGILVFYKETIAQVLELLQQFLDQHSSQLRRGVPILTKQIGPGLGYSECPKGETPLSFHLHRCQLIAQGLIEAWEHNQDAIASIIQCFERQNLSLSTPYLNPGAQDFQWVIDPLDGTTNFLHGTIIPLPRSPLVLSSPAPPSILSFPRLPSILLSPPSPLSVSFSSQSLMSSSSIDLFRRGGLADIRF